MHRVEGPLEDDRFKELQDQHCVHAPSCKAVQHKMSWKHVYAWHLSEVEVYETPLPYKNEHSVIWLDVRKAVADFAPPNDKTQVHKIYSIIPNGVDGSCKLGSFKGSEGVGGVCLGVGK